MGKTFKEYKGEKYNAKDRKKTKEKKYFGNTSGTHSRKTEGVAVKGTNFVKYGWPFELRNGKVIKNLQKDREAKKQLIN
jgi:hypothetical protein